MITWTLDFAMKTKLQFGLTLWKAVSPSLIPVIISCRRTPSLLIELQTFIHKSVFVEEWKLAWTSSPVCAVGTKTTRSRALFAHIRKVYHTLSVSCPVSAAAVTIHAICDIIVCLAITPFLIFVIVTGRCTPNPVVFVSLGRTFCECHPIVNEWEDARCIIVIS